MKLGNQMAQKKTISFGEVRKKNQENSRKCQADGRIWTKKAATVPAKSHAQNPARINAR